MDPGEAFIGALSAQIRAEKAALKLSVNDLADKSGLPFETLKRYVSGARDIPASRLHKISKALGLDTSELIARAEHRTDHEGTP